MPFLGPLLLVLTAAPTTSNSSARPVNFAREVRPILAMYCFACHGPDEKQRKADLRLDRKADALMALTPGDPTKSELYSRMASHDADTVMPPPKAVKKPNAAQIELVKRWIQEGANWSEHWAFVSPKRPAIPTAGEQAWAVNAIDSFILARLERENIKPSPMADRATLARRLHLDLLGLPPEPKVVVDFVKDQAPNAYEKLVDHLLESPHFGERWGRHWLDLARYADSDGYLGDGLRPNAYLYRDWVIKAINDDLPYDKFTIEQIAGDLLPNATPKQKAATGFHRNATKNTEAGADREEDRTRQAVDRVSTVGTAWLGLTIGCAECHSHKYDPLSHHEFYSLYAFFNSVDDTDVSLPVPKESTAAAVARVKTWEADLARAEAAAKAEGVPGTDEILPLLANRTSKPSSEDKKKVAAFLGKLDGDTRQIFEDYATTAKAKPGTGSFKAPGVKDSEKPRQTHIHLRGDFRSLGEAVEPGTPAVLPPLTPRGKRADRLDLARWLADPAHPLTARTAVNHVWLHLFGRGLVNTADNFGTAGEPPSHADLLDWLAVEFVEKGWSRKALIKLIVMSNAYRQSSRTRTDLNDRDPLNVLVARQGRFRVEAEIIRDVALGASGLLHPTIGGPGVRPVVDAQVTAVSRNKDWVVSPAPDRYRRGMYIVFRRATPYPMLTTFDSPDSTATCARRDRSNSPLQALTLLNDPVFVECSRELGRKLATQKGDTETWIRELVQRCLSRSPSNAELSRLTSLYAEQRELLAKSSAADVKDIAGSPIEGVELQELAARVAVARIVMNLDEFITRE